MRACLACASQGVETFLDLGLMALANRFLSPEEARQEEPRYPLRLGYCHRCGLVQLIEIVPPPAMFQHYLYISSISEILKAHLESLADMAVRRFSLGPTDLIMDIGCNDGTLLHAFQKHGVRTLGVDPAANLLELSSRLGIEVHCDFFGARLAPLLVQRYGQARHVTMTNTFQHIPDLPDVVRGLEVVLAPGGTLLIELHYLMDLLAERAFDTIYHEHCFYWALRPLKRFFESHGFCVVDVERLPLHHGQLRVIIQRQGEATSISPRVGDLMALEEQHGLDRFETYQAFAKDVVQIRGRLLALIDGLISEGRTVVGYGAPAKGSTLLNFTGIGPERLRYIVDRSPLKQGRLTPGTRIPIVSPERLLEDQPDAVVVLAWNFVDEIVRQQAEYLRRGGRFIVPVPSPRVLEMSDAVVNAPPLR